MRYSLKEIPLEMEQDGLETRGVECGDVYSRYIDLPAGVDFTPLLVGLPHDQCQCPHWGYVLNGSITLRFADGHEETNRAGDVYYWAAGHTGWTDEGVTFLEFSPCGDPSGPGSPLQATRRLTRRAGWWSTRLTR